MREFLRASLRRWYVVVACGVATVLMYMLALSPPPVWTGAMTVAVLAPADLYQSTLQKPDAALLASVAVIKLNDAPHRLESSTSSTTLYGRGTTRGTSVRMEYEGNQWEPSVQRPYVLLEAVDQDPQAVYERLESSYTAFEEQVRAIEREQKVSRDQRVQLLRVPTEAVIYQVPVSPSRAMLGSLLLGVALVLWSVPGVDRLLLRRRERRAEARTAEPALP